MKTTAPYGSWKSPITSDLIVAKAVSVGKIITEGETIYWVESRPEEKGRSVIVRRLPSGQVEDINPAPFNARTRVHEYGGGEYLVDQGIVYFSNFADQRVYRLEPGKEPNPITPPIDLRYADGVM
ncbi:MAG: S9 family peptidase, partial [Anaerolineaceae bacterium]|nr:S9 family peptidase [Anaerolineaceae bacterium]